MSHHARQSPDSHSPWPGRQQESSSRHHHHQRNLSSYGASQSNASFLQNEHREREESFRGPKKKRQGDPRTLDRKRFCSSPLGELSMQPLCPDSTSQQSGSRQSSYRENVQNSSNTVRRGSFDEDVISISSSPAASSQSPSSAPTSQANLYCRLCQNAASYRSEHDFLIHLTFIHFREKIMRIVCPPYECLNCKFSPPDSYDEDRKIDELLMHYGCQEKVAMKYYYEECSDIALATGSDEASKDEGSVSVTCAICNASHGSQRIFVRHISLRHYTKELCDDLPKKRPFICPYIDCGQEKGTLHSLMLHYGCEHNVSIELYNKDKNVGADHKVTVSESPLLSSPHRLEDQAFPFTSAQDSPKQDVFSPASGNSSPLLGTIITSTSRAHKVTTRPSGGDSPHGQGKRSTDLVCHMCKKVRKTFVTQKSLNYHLMFSHHFTDLPKAGPYTCPKCNADFDQKNIFAKHFLDHHWVEFCAEQKTGQSSKGAATSLSEQNKAHQKMASRTKGSSSREKDSSSREKDSSSREKDSSSRDKVSSSRDKDSSSRDKSSSKGKDCSLRDRESTSKGWNASKGKAESSVRDKAFSKDVEFAARSKEKSYKDRKQFLFEETEQSLKLIKERKNSFSQSNKELKQGQRDNKVNLNDESILPHRVRQTVHKAREMTARERLTHKWENTSFDGQKVKIEELEAKILDLDSKHGDALKQKDKEFERWITQKEEALESANTSRKKLEEQLEEANVDVADMKKQLEQQQEHRQSMEMLLAEKQSHNLELLKDKKSLEKKVMTLENKIPNLDKRAYEKEQECLELKQTVKENMAAYNSLAATMSVKDEEILELMRSLEKDSAESQKKCKKLEKQVETQKVRGDKLLKEKKEKLSELKELTKTYKGEEAELKSQISKLVKENKHLQAKSVQERNQEMKKLEQDQGRVEEVEQMLKESESQVEILGTERNALLDSLERIQRIMKDFEGIVQDKNEKLKDANERLEETETNLEEALQKLKGLKGLDREKRDLTRQIKQLQATLKDWENRQFTNVKLISGLQKENATLQKKVKDFEENHTGAEEELYEMSTKIRKQDKDLMFTKEKLAEAEKEYAKLSSRLESKSQEIESLTNKNLSLEQNVRDLEREVRGTSNDNSEVLQTEINNREEELKHLRIALISIQKQLTSAVAEKKELTTELNKSKMRNEKFETDYSLLVAQHETVKTALVESNRKLRLQADGLKPETKSETAKLNNVEVQKVCVKTEPLEEPGLEEENRTSATSVSNSCIDTSRQIILEAPNSYELLSNISGSSLMATPIVSSASTAISSRPMPASKKRFPARPSPAAPRPLSPPAPRPLSPPPAALRSLSPPPTAPTQAFISLSEVQASPPLAPNLIPREPLPPSELSDVDMEEFFPDPEDSPLSFENPSKRTSADQAKAKKKISRPIAFLEDVTGRTHADEDNIVCGICEEFDPPLPQNEEQNGAQYKTEWVGCDCDRWYHKQCTNLKRLTGRFSCRSVKRKCLKGLSTNNKLTKKVIV